MRRRGGSDLAKSARTPAPLRYSSPCVTLVTGRGDPSQGRTDVGWEALAQVGGTIVVLMGVAHLREIAARLTAGGLSPDTPAAAVRGALAYSGASTR